LILRNPIQSHGKLVTNDKLTCEDVLHSEVTNWLDDEPTAFKCVDDVIVLVFLAAFPSSTFIWIPCFKCKMFKIVG